MTIDDAEHYTPEQRAAIIASYPAARARGPHQGHPSMGSGRVFPVSEEAIIVCEPFRSRPLAADQRPGLRLGSPVRGAVNLAWDRDATRLRLQGVRGSARARPIIHAAAVKPWGPWIPCAWPHDGLQHDKGSGEALKEQYKAQGLNMLPEKATFMDGGNGVEAGVMDMLDRMQTGRWKVFSTCGGWLRSSGFITAWTADRQGARRPDFGVSLRPDDATNSPSGVC
jgi:hypothetical protein